MHTFPLIIPLQSMPCALSRAEICNQETSHTHKCRRQRQTWEGHEKCNARQQELQEVKRKRERERCGVRAGERENKQNYFSTPPKQASCQR